MPVGSHVPYPASLQVFMCQRICVGGHKQACEQYSHLGGVPFGQLCSMVSVQLEHQVQHCLSGTVAQPR